MFQTTNQSLLLGCRESLFHAPGSDRRVNRYVASDSNFSLVIHAGRWIYELHAFSQVFVVEDPGIDSLSLQSIAERIKMFLLAPSTKKKR